MNLESLAIATISWARDPYEEQVLTAALTTLSEQGYPMFMTDAGSEAPYVRNLQQLPGNTVLGPVKGVWPQARTSLKAAAASGAEWIFYAEPDKKDFFARHLALMLEQARQDARPGVYLAARSDAAFASFPVFQQMTETTINRCHAELLGADFDYVYGPFLLHRSVVPYLDALPDQIGWGWRPYAFLVARRLGLQVNAYTGDFFCPDDQRQDSRAERVYRMRQLAQNMEGLALAEGADLEGLRSLKV